MSFLSQAIYSANQKGRQKGESREAFFARAALAVDGITDDQFATLPAKTRAGVNAAMKAANAGKDTEPKPQKDST